MYYLYLAKQYMWHNKARTLYSVFGIVLTFILCFCVMTVGYSSWDYTYYEFYNTDPYELYTLSSKEEPFTAQMIRNAKKLAEDEAVEECAFRETDSSRRVLPGQLTAGKNYSLQLRLKDTKDLKGSAAALSERYGFDIRVYDYVASYLRQDDSASTALTDVLITLMATIFGFFSVAILRNTMMIAVTERGRDYGLLRCVGLSERQQRLLLFTEGILMSLAASVLGMALGYGLLQGMEGWLIRTLGLAEYFRFRFYPMAAGYTTLLCVGVTVFSLVEPARLSAQVSPLDALRGKLAKELTVGKALMLLAHKLSGGRSKRRERKSLAELVFGAPGFYAHRNATRRGGAGAAVFLAMLFSSAFLMTILSFSDSYTATLRQQIGGFSTPYREKLYYQTGAEQLSVYDAGRDEELREKLMAMKDVQDCFWLMERDSYLNQYSLLRYDPGLKALYAEGAVDTVVELGFTKEDMEKERPYLAEGELDYERMLSEGGVLLCDHSPAQKEGERQSSYRIGDKIRSLSIEGAAEAKKVYLAAVAVVSERHGLDAWVDAEHRIVSFSEGEMQYREREGISSAENPLSTRTRQADDTEFDRLEEELLNELEAAGYACAAYMPEKSLRMTDVLDAVKQCVFERGEVDTYTIQGILSEEICTGDSVEAFRPSGEKQYAYIRLVFPMEAMTEQYRRIAQAEGMSGQTVRYSMLDYRTYGGAFALSLAVDRPAEMLNERLRGLAERNGMWYTNLFEEKGQDYFALANYLNVIKVACTLIGGFILLICLVQIINTLQADMRLRRKEMWLYDVVGMDPKQKALMLLLEHGFGAVTALLLGMLVSMVFSYLFIKKLLDVNGEYVWSWPVLPALLLFFGISGILLAVNAAELRKS